MECQKNLFKPQIPSNMPAGYYFLVYPSKDKYGRDYVTVALMRERKYWFDKKVSSSDFCILRHYRSTEKEMIELHMRELIEKQRTSIHRNTYLYGRHP